MGYNLAHLSADEVREVAALPSDPVARRRYLDGLTDHRWALVDRAMMKMAAQQKGGSPLMGTKDGRNCR